MDHPVAGLHVGQGDGDPIDGDVVAIHGEDEFFTLRRLQRQAVADVGGIDTTGHHVEEQYLAQCTLRIGQQRIQCTGGQGVKGIVGRRKNGERTVAA